MQSTTKGLSWVGIIRLAVVQACLGAIVVLTTSTMNRVMVVELALPAMLPGILVGIHYMVQIVRLHMGYGSDKGGTRTPWIIAGVGVLAIGGVLAAIATAWMETNPAAGIALSVLAFTLIGGGVSAAGTSLLVLMATVVAPPRRAATASIAWTMMIFGFVLTTAIAGNFLDPFTTERLITVTATTGLIAFTVACIAVWRVEATTEKFETETTADARANMPSFREAVREVWAEKQARQFAIFVFVSMLAFSAQDLILEPFAGAVFGMTPGESTQLTSFQNMGTLLGMILIGVVGSRRVMGGLKNWTAAGCVLSALALMSLTAGGMIGQDFPLRGAVFTLGLGNGIFAVAAIGSMMGLAAEGQEAREGMRMGMWGAAQAIAFAAGGLLGTLSIDVSRILFDTQVTAYGVVFMAEGILFLVAGVLGYRVHKRKEAEKDAPMGDLALATGGQ